MKLLVILSIEESAEDVRKILARQKVSVYSETDVYGFRTEEHQPDITNWFAQGDHRVYSKMYFSIQGEKCVNRILKEIEAFNEKMGEENSNPIHAYQLDVEKVV